VVDVVLDCAAAGRTTVAVDLGCGTGQVTLPLARIAEKVMAVDVSPAMVERLLERASKEGLDNIVAAVFPIEGLVLAPRSVDLVVSNYALHHLSHADKKAAVVAAAQWLRPGGRLVVGDMMFGRGRTARDRSVIKTKVAALARRGPRGWWRLLKNVFRFTFRFRERPATMGMWSNYFEEAGLKDVTVVPVVSEAAVVSGAKR
jgi:ubiquinone/menaquinone biosynthesis C-methylase UbiE